MPSEKNVKLLEEVKASLARCTIAIATNYTGLPVPAMNDLRRRLREQGIEYKVVKNTITVLAGRETGKPGIEQIIEGPTAIAFGYGDPAVVARVLDEYVRATRSSLTVRGAVLEGQVLKGDAVTRLARLPSREALVAQLIGQLKGPLAGLVRVLQAPTRGLVTVLERRLEQARS